MVELTNLDAKDTTSFRKQSVRLPNDLSQSTASPGYLGRRCRRFGTVRRTDGQRRAFCAPGRLRDERQTSSLFQRSTIEKVVTTKVKFAVVTVQPAMLPPGANRDAFASASEPLARLCNGTGRNGHGSSSVAFFRMPRTFDAQPCLGSNVEEFCRSRLFPDRLPSAGRSAGSGSPEK